MLTYLTNHAMKHLWVSPRQDTQAIIEPKRVNGAEGVWNSIRLGWEKLILPEQGVKFHVYQIGQLCPDLLGLFDTENKWKRIDEAMMETNMIVELYTVNGVMTPRFTAWYRWTENKNLVLAVKENVAIPWNMYTEKLYMRVYSGAYFSTLRQNKQLDVIKTYGSVIVDTSSRQDAAIWYQKYRNEKGHCFIWVNGWFRGLLNTALLKEGDVLEMVYDSTIYKKVIYALGALPTFDSLLDKKGKYLLMHTHSENKEGPTIDYFDDIDIYLSKKDNYRFSDTEKGAYYHRNQPDAVRQLTHRDYSLVVPYVRGIINANKFFETNRGVYINLFIRKSGLDSVLPLVHNRIHELYKLSYKYRVSAVHGVRSNVTEWKAAELERSAFIKIMGETELVDNDEEVVNAYGYNGISVISGNTPIQYKDFDTQTNRLRVPLAYGLRQNSTAYEYDINGKNIHFREHHLAGCYYNIRNQKDTKLVENISGIGSDAPDDVYNATEYTFTQDADYRVYKCPKGDELKPHAWVDITNNESQYRIVEGKLQWVADMREFTTIIRSDRRFLSYSLNLQPQSGLLTFVLRNKIAFNGPVAYHNLFVPFGELDVWLNGHSLVEGIDYIVQFPRIVITNKKYLVDPSLTNVQRVSIRYTGFPKTENNRLVSRVKRDVGYIKHGQLSRNKRFDIRDDKVLRIVADGRTLHRDALKFSETTGALKVQSELAEGAPYEIRDIVVPVRDLSKRDTYTLRDASEATDKRVSDYLSQFLREEPIEEPTPIKELYRLYSPYLGHILQSLINGSFVFDKLTEHYNDNDVIEAVKKFDWWLRFDPIKSEKSLVDLEYCIVHPHLFNEVITVDPYQYKFMEALVRIYFKGKVKLNHFLRIGEYRGSN